MSVLFSLTSIRKSFGTTVALEVGSLTLQSGSLYILTGQNGSGKSTLLDILALLSQPEQGEVVFNGQRVGWKGRELNLLRKRVTLLHQSPYLFAGTVAANVAFGLKARGICGEELQRTVAEALELVGLKGFEGRDVRQLSGGESRRVALARALALRPELLLLDEPLANLDKESVQVVEQVIASLPGCGTTVVMSTHDPMHSERLEGEVIQLVEGRLASANASGPAYCTAERKREILKTLFRVNSMTALEG